MKKVFVSLLLLLSVEPVFAQSAFIPLHDESGYYLRRLEILSGGVSDQLHFSAWPLQRRYAVRYLDSIQDGSQRWSPVDHQSHEFLLTDNDEWSAYSGASSRKPFLKYLYRDKASLYQHRDDDFLVKVNPVFDFVIGIESDVKEALYTNTRGIELRGWVAKKVGYYFFVTENQARFPAYVQERTDSFGAVPGEGYYKDFKTNGVDFLSAKGYFDFTVAKFITMQFGTDKNFIGNGIRSLALSDFSEDYLFLKLQTQVWKISYQNLFVDLTADFIRGGDKLLPKKYGALHHLSLNATHFLNVGVWESVIFHRNDGYELQYLNPIIFYRSIEQLLGSPDNVVIGLDLRMNLLRHLSVYGQFMLDDFNIQVSKSNKGYWANKFGFQLGAQYVNAFTVSNLDLQLEWNHVRPYTYTHNDTIANYSNYNQPLAHPLGANFNEWIGVVRYQPVLPLSFKWVVTIANSGRDTLGSNFGSDIFIPTTSANVLGEYGNVTGQGIATDLFLSEWLVTWMMKHNLFLDAGFVMRRNTSDLKVFESSGNIFRIGIRMNVANRRFQF